MEEPDELPADVAEAIEALHLLHDEELWRAARQRLAPEKAVRDLILARRRRAEQPSWRFDSTAPSWSKHMREDRSHRARLSSSNRFHWLPPED